MSIQDVTVYAGVDVASKHLDLFFADTGKSERIKNDDEAIGTCQRWSPLDTTPRSKRPTRI